MRIIETKTKKCVQPLNICILQLNGDSLTSGGCMDPRGARIWIFVGFVLGFAAIIAAVWTMIASFSDGGEYMI